MGWRIRGTDPDEHTPAPAAGYANPGHDLGHSAGQGVTVSGATIPFTPTATPGQYTGDNGAEAPEETPSRWRQIKDRHHRHRYTLKPWMILTGLPTFTEALHLVPGQPLIKIAVPLLATAALVITQWKRRKIAHERAYAIVCTVYGGAWAAWATLAGVFHGFALLALLAGWAPAAYLWWDRHMIRPAAALKETTHEAPPRDPIRDRWDTHVDTPAMFPGAHLDPPKSFDGGRSYLIRGVPGRHTTSRFTQRIEDLASALHLGVERLSIEAVTEPGPDRHAANAQMLVMDEQDHSAVTRKWEGPTLDPATGLCTPAYYPDGAPVYWRLFKVEKGLPNRAINSNISGNTGSGKSRFVDLLVLERMHSGLFVQWWMDGKTGQSSPALAEFVDWPATRREEWLRMLRAAWKVMRARREYLSQLEWVDEDGEIARGVEYFPASSTFPFLQIVIDEAQEVLKDPRCMTLIKRLLREGNSCGIGIDFVSQIMIQTELGESDAVNAGPVRTLSKGNIAAFHADDNSAAMVTIGPRMQVNPQDLPPAPGYAYMASDSMRRMHSRTVYVTKSFRYWAKRAEQTALDALSVGQADTEGYGDRFTRRAAEAEQIAAGNFGDLDSELSVVLGERLPGQDAPNQTLENMTVKKLVRDIVASAGGPMKREDVIAAVAATGKKASDSAVIQALSGWVKAGYLIKTGEHGMYDVAGRAEAADNPDVVPINR